MKRPIPSHFCEHCNGSGSVTDYNYNGPFEAVCDACEGVGDYDVETCRECGCRVEVLSEYESCLACDVSMQLTENSEFHHSSRQRELAERIADVINGDWSKRDMKNSTDRTAAILSALNLGA